MVDMCMCVICSQWMAFTTETFMCNFCCCCHLWAQLHVQIGQILLKSSKVYHKKRERERDSRTTTHARIAKVMGNYKGTGWQLWLQSSEPDEATYLSCQLACTCERMCDTQSIYSLYRSLSYTKRVEMPLRFPIYGNTLRLPFEPRTSNALYFYWNRKIPLSSFCTTCLTIFIYPIIWIHVVASLPNQNACVSHFTRLFRNHKVHNKVADIKQKYLVLLFKEKEKKLL